MRNEENLSNIPLIEEEGSPQLSPTSCPKVERLTIKIPSNFYRANHRSNTNLSNMNRSRNSGSDSMSKIEDELLQIMKRTDRTDEEAWTLYQNLKDYKFFNLFTNVTNEVYQKECLIHIFKRLKYEEIPARQLIFEEGDASNGKMYIVLSGDCLVMKRNPESILINGGRGETLNKKGRAATQLPQKGFYRTSIFLNQVHNNNGSQSHEQIDDYDSKIGTSEEFGQSSPSNSWGLTRNATMGAARETSSIRRGRASPRKLGQFPGKEEDFEDEAQAALRNIQAMREERERRRLDLSYYGTVVNTIGKGGFFGERALEANQKRSASVITERDCEILVLSKEDYMLIKKTFRNKLRDLFNFVIDNLPGLHYLQSPVLAEYFVYIFEEKVLSIKNHVFHEGDTGDNFYLIYSGTCEVYRTVSIDETPAVPGRLGKVRPFFNKTKKIKEKIPLTIINQGYLIGEELLDPSNEASRYTYSVQVTSDTCRLLAINKERFQSKFSNEAFEQIIAIFKEKKQHKEQLLSEQMTKRDLEVLESKEDEHLFISTRRKAPQTIAVDTHLQHQTFYNSYKRIVPMVETNSPFRRNSTLEERESVRSKSPDTGSPKKIKSPGLGTPSSTGGTFNYNRDLDFLRENKLFPREKSRRESHKSEHSPKVTRGGNMMMTFSTMASTGRIPGKSRLSSLNNNNNNNNTSSESGVLKGKLMNHLANSQSAAHLLDLKTCVEEENKKNAMKINMNSSISKGTRGLDSKDQLSRLNSEFEGDNEKPFVPLLPGVNSKESIVGKTETYATTNSALNTPIIKKSEPVARSFVPQKSREYLHLNLPDRFNMTQEQQQLNESKTLYLLNNSKLNSTHDYFEGMSVLLEKKMRSNRKNFAILNSSQQTRLQKFVAKMNNIPTKYIERERNNSSSKPPTERNNFMMTTMQPFILKPLSQSPMKIKKKSVERMKATPKKAFTPGILKNVSMEDLYFSGIHLK